LLEFGRMARTAKVTIQINRTPRSIQVKTNCDIAI
jgi:hypothetical protein